MKTIFFLLLLNKKILKIQWQIFFWRPNMICFEHANPGDYNAAWFAASECSGRCQLLATMKCFCVPSLSLPSPVMLWMVPSASLTPCLGVGGPWPVPRNRSPPLPLVSRDASQAAPFPVLLVTQLLLSLAGGGQALRPLGFQCCVYFSSCCSCVPLGLSHFFTGWVITTAPEHSCTFSILNLGLNLTAWASFWHFPSFVLILQIINLNEEGSDFSLSAAPGPLLHSKRPADKHCV